MRLLLSATVALIAIQSSTRDPLNLVRTIQLPRVEGRIDHLAIDAATDHVFVAALGNNTAEVVDLKNGTHVKSVPGFHEPQGIAAVPEVKAIAVANGQGGTVQLLDREDYRVMKTIPLGDDADNVRYEPATKRLYVGYGSGAVAVIDPGTGQRVGEMKLAGHPESFQLERQGSRIFVNVPAAKQIAVLDRAAMKALTTWPVVGAESNFPMALDEANHRLFIGCRRPAKLLVYDTSSGKAVASVDIVGDTDDLFYDAARKRVYVSGGEGFIDVVQQRDADHYSRTGHVPTAAGARTSLFDPAQGRLYLAVPHRGSQKAEIRVYEVRE
jgi:DNA-binding beta-propeller fold protein YncE